MSRRVIWAVGMVVISGCGRTAGPAGSAASLAPTSITIAAGDGQSAPPGAPLLVGPAVLVADSTGHPVPGAVVTFTVTSGGGSVESTEVVTAKDGGASCGAWTLGTIAGLQELSATADGVASVTFSAAALRSSPQLAVTLRSPRPGQLVAATLDVTAALTATEQIDGVTATVRRTTVPLTNEPSGDGDQDYSGSVPISDTASGTAMLVVTATDVLGNVADAAVAVRVDRSPVVTVTLPDPEVLVRSKVTASATCTDDGPAGCTLFGIWANDTTTQLASGGSPLSTELDLSAFDGQAVNLNFIGVDASGQQSIVWRRVYVESSARLEVVATAPGTVWDFDGTRLLVVDTATSPSALEILDASTGTTTIVESTGGLAFPPSPTTPSTGAYGFLTPSGAIYLVSPGGPCSVHEWREGGVIDLGTAECGSLRVRGGDALFVRDELGGSTLVRRDLAGGTSESLATAAIGGWTDLAANGDVVYAVDGSIYRWRGGASAAITTGSSPGAFANPRTDGTYVVYGGPGDGPDTGVFLNDGQTQTVLTTTASEVLASAPGYVVANGWVAYTSRDDDGTFQIWRHGPTGEQQVTFFGSVAAHVEALADDGTMVLATPRRRYRSSPGVALQDVGSSRFGTTILRNGRFYVIVGGTVLGMLD